MKWLTRSHLHAERVACPWLISRFIDNQAEFLFVPTSLIEETVKNTGAIPFDVPGAELGHKDNRCSFESIIAKYELKEPGLLRLAKIVHAADIEEDESGGESEVKHTAPPMPFGGPPDGAFGPFGN